MWNKFGVEVVVQPLLTNRNQMSQWLPTTTKEILLNQPIIILIRKRRLLQNLLMKRRKKWRMIFLVELERNNLTVIRKKRSNQKLLNQHNQYQQLRWICLIWIQDLQLLCQHPLISKFNNRVATCLMICMVQILQLQHSLQLINQSQIFWEAHQFQQIKAVPEDSIWWD